MVLNNSCHSDLLSTYCVQRASWLVPVVKNPPASAGDIRNAGSIPGWGRSPGGGRGNLFQYSCLENPCRLVDP